MSFLLDTRATLTLIKVGHLKEDTLIHEKQLALTGVTGVENIEWFWIYVLVSGEGVCVNDVTEQSGESCSAWERGIRVLPPFLHKCINYLIN